MNVFRLKSHLLKNQDNRWFLQNQPYTGIIFFDKDNFQLDVFEVEDGYVTKPYISPCQKTLTDILQSPISIDSSSFSNEEEDIYGCGTIPQMYQNSIYQGMSYNFRNGKCIYEGYSNEDGITESKIHWSYNPNNPMLDDLKQFELQNHDTKLPKSFYYYYRSNNNFSYYLWDDKDYYEHISISYFPDSGMIKSLFLQGDVLKTKSYLNCPIQLPEIFGIIENHHNFIFCDKVGHLVLRIDKSYIQQLFDTWLKNNSFKNIKSLSIGGVEGLEDLSIFSNKKYFRSLAELAIDETLDKSVIRDLKIKNPNLIITLY